jgi:Flp pilus assembly protein TadD
MHARATVENSAVLGSWYASHEQYPCARETFQAGLKADPGSAQLHYLLGLSMVAAGHPEQALPEIRKSAELDPHALKPHMLLATIYDQMGNTDKAESEWRRALAIDPKAEPALDGLTALLMKRRDYADVIQLLENAPRTEKLSIALARAFGLLNDADAAEKVLNQALAEHPGSMSLQQAMLVVLVKQRNYEVAIRLARSLAEAHPGDTDAELDYFRLLVLRNHVDEAAPLGAKLLEARPKDPEILFLNGLVKRSTGDYAQAKALLEQAVALQPDFNHSRYELGNTLLLLKEWPEARQQLEKAIELGTNDPEVHFALAKALRGMGDAEAAAAETRKYQQMKKDDEDRLEAAESIAQGDAALNSGDSSKAISLYKEALEQQPANPNYHFKMAIALDHASDSAGARQELEKAIGLNPSLPGPHNALGSLLSRSGDPEGAVNQYRAAVTAAPGWPEAWISLAAELAVTRQFSQARQAVAKALELEPQNQEARELQDQLARDPAAQKDHP